MLTEILITEFGVEGDGVGFFENEKIFVPFSAPGDRVLIEIERIKKRTYIHLKEILEPSPLRSKAPCAHFGLCGGCRLQHLSNAAYEELKLNHVKKHLDFFSVTGYQLAPVKRVPPKVRRRITLQYRKRSDIMTVGFAVRGTHRLIDVRECHLVTPEIEEFIPKLRAFLDQWLTSGKGHVNILQTSVGLDVDVHNVQVKRLSLEDHEQFTAFANKHNLARLTYKNRLVVEYQKPTIEFAGIPVEVTAQGFLQASDLADRLLQESVASFMPEQSRRIADLFCGRGTFTLLLQKYGYVDGYELDDPGLKALNTAARAYNLPIQTFSRNLFESPLTGDELGVYDVVCIDPPRAGALQQCQQLADSLVKHIIYVSCSPASFARDAKILQEGGYYLRTVIPVDQFLWSDHLELVGYFIKDA
jgi:23S rRNA (uracil1939-C5)-methyltransferase